MESTKEKISLVYKNLKDKFGWKNVMQSTKLINVVINVGVGRVRKDKSKIDLIIDRLTKITGQKPSARKAKKSIASFKVREGDVVGYVVTVRGENMYAFVDKFINITIPRMKDFQGINRTSVDSMGNLTVGIRDHSIFPEIKDENLQDIFPLEVTFVTTAKNKEEGLLFFESFGIPFKSQ